MKNRKEIAIIGHFGGKENFLDGQTVKTQVLYSELLQHTDWHIQKVDTYYKHKNPMKLAVQLVIALLTTKDIIVITSQNGRRFFFPILFVFSRIIGTRVYHDVIGGRLGKFTVECPNFKKYLNSFKVNWVETASLKQELANLGVSNCEVLPNFKRLSPVKIEEIYGNTKEPYKLCTFSRVMKEKGIADAVDAVKAVNEQLGRTVYELDIYGQIDPNQTEWFSDLQKDFPEYVQYKGQVPFDKSVETLKNYFALLFPTYYDGEGFAGTLLDAMASGTPVIASDWKYNPEIVKEGKTGILYPARDQNALVDRLHYAYQNVEKWNTMRYHCLEEAKKYQPEEVLKVIVEKIEIGS